MKKKGKAIEIVAEFWKSNISIWHVALLYDILLFLMWINETVAQEIVTTLWEISLL
jgi:hypothetical protein